jgi:hypothetical protein
MTARIETFLLERPGVTALAMLGVVVAAVVEIVASRVLL